MNESSIPPTAAALIIGNEILSGRTQDVNINVIATKLAEIGVRLQEVRVVPDIEAEIVAAVNELRSRVTHLFTTGGIGPTHDDITAESIAKAFNVPLVEHPEARARLESYYKKTELNAARLKMAMVPEGSTLIDNPVSSAPGFQVENVYVLAGVPRIMVAMLENIIAGLQHGPAIVKATLHCHLPESLLAEGLGEVAQRYPQLDIGSYPSFRPEGVGLALVVRGTDCAAVTAATESIGALIARCGETPVIETN